MSILTDEEIKAASNRAFDIVRAMPDNKVDGETWDYQFAIAIEAAVQKKLAEQAGEPVAWLYSQNGIAQFTENKRDWYEAAGIDEVTSLYTETQIIAAQQRAAENCAKVCDSIDSRASSNPPALCAMNIRRQQWREHL